MASASVAKPACVIGGRLMLIVDLVGIVCSKAYTAIKVAVLRIALIATFDLRPSWSQAIHDDSYLAPTKYTFLRQVCVWSMCWHQRSPPFSNIWGC